MSNRRSSILLKLISAFGFLPILAAPMLASAQEDQITFHRDIEPILQRSCQNCHRAGGVGPMPLVTYEQVAPFAETLKAEALNFIFLSISPLPNILTGL
ncbi:MAG: hypothetical protein P8N11_00625, partial [Gammaproteobacteria bacterium]|nr:hypothetical protein [Gammaproteobacteria bacterium]